MTEFTHERPGCPGPFKPNGLDRDNASCVFLCSGCGATGEFPAEVVKYPDRMDPPKWPPTGTIRVSLDS